MKRPSDNAELANARRIVLTLTSELGALQDKVERRRQQIKNAEPGTQVNVLHLWDEGLAEEEAQANLKNQELLRDEATMQSLVRRPTGREAEREVCRRIRDFMEGDRADISFRDEFNGWLFREGLGFVINTRTGEVLFGRLEIGSDRKLIDVDCVMDDAAALGLDLENVREIGSA